MAFRRRHFQQNRSKSAIEIATDFLVQTRLQDSPKTSNADGISQTPSSPQSANQQRRYRIPPLASRGQSQASSLGGGSKGVEDVSSKDGRLRGEHTGSVIQSDPTCTPPSHSRLPLSLLTVTSERAEGGGREGQQQQQQQQQREEEEEEEEVGEERRKSWRKVIFDCVCTTVVSGSTLLSSGGSSVSSKRQKKSAEVRARWKKATLETLVVLRLKKDECDGTGQEDQQEGSADHRLGYVELTPCPQEAREAWEALLTSASASSTGSPPSLEYQTLLGHVKKGVPRELRGMVWRFLALQQSCHSAAENCSSDMYETPYSDLLDRFSADQHAILIDLGRTFPGHPYFVKPLGPGQVSLFNLLKAYSLLDIGVGYCQGVSFIAGLLLMHMEEAGAFEMIRHLMLGLGLRSLYCPSMAALQMKLYQMVRLLHDHDPEMHRHLEKHEVVPALYATPWFLTLFASQYPLCFVARIFDLLFLQGPDVIFKVALTLLTCHRELILQIDCFEDLVDFLKSGLPEMARIQSERVTGQVIEMDIHQQLHDYEIEFHVFRDELLSSSHPTPSPGASSSSSSTTTTTTTSTSTTTNNNNDINGKKLISLKQSQKLNLQQAVLRLQDEKKDLADQLARAHGELCTLHMAVNRFRLNEDKFKAKVRALELERSALLNTVSQLRTAGAEQDQASGKGC